jgi:hypothetical protein
MAYGIAVQALKLWLVAGLLLTGCGSEAPPRAPRAPDPAPVASAPSQPAAPLVTACRAKPSTVYGAEPVVFELEGPAASTPVAVDARDAAGKVQASGSAAVPGTWQAPDLGSGDFSLHIASSSVTCLVTVNRDLSRASSNPR